MPNWGLKTDRYSVTLRHVRGLEADCARFDQQPIIRMPAAASVSSTGGVAVCSFSGFAGGFNARMRRHVNFSSPE